MGYKTDYIGHDAQYQRNKVAGLNGWNDDETWQSWRAEILGLIASPGFPTSGKILELGCGAGDVALLFARKGYQVCGIDIAPTAIAWAKENALKVNLKAQFNTGDVRNLGRWGNKTFDIVIDGHCLHCIIGDDRAEVLEETYRVLKPKGLFYVSTMCGEPREPEVLRLYDPATRCMVRNGVAGRYFGTPGNILKELEKTGFEILEHRIQENKDTQDDLIVWAIK